MLHNNFLIFEPNFLKNYCFLVEIKTKIQMDDKLNEMDDRIATQLEQLDEKMNQITIGFESLREDVAG